MSRASSSVHALLTAKSVCRLHAYTPSSEGLKLRDWHMWAMLLVQLQPTSKWLSDFLSVFNGSLPSEHSMSFIAPFARLLASYSPLYSHSLLLTLTVKLFSWLD